MLPLCVCIFLIGTVLGNGTPESVQRLMEDPDLFEGDMMGVMDADRNVIATVSHRWPSARVPYVIDPASARYEDLILEAMANYEQNTCVRFVRRTYETDYIRIYPGRGCNSFVGKQGNEQVLNLGFGCENVGIIIHELGHALGLFHEQSRSDRDDYLEIKLENVKKGAEFNFQKLAPHQNLLLTPFNYDSIMIYPETAFSKNGKYTMRAKNGQKLGDAEDKTEMTPLDIIRIKKMYC